MHTQSDPCSEYMLIVLEDNGLWVVRNDLHVHGQICSWRLLRCYFQGHFQCRGMLFRLARNPPCWRKVRSCKRSASVIWGAQSRCAPRHSFPFFQWRAIATVPITRAFALFPCHTGDHCSPNPVTAVASAKALSIEEYRVIISVSANDSTPCSLCSSLDCGVHGQCKATGPNIHCICVDGYSGDRCQV